jgi:site-specific DNA-methyltransferase (adenine-specific)
MPTDLTQPYYADDHVTLWHGDCLEIDAWLAADVLVTDPPYGIGWSRPSGFTNSTGGGSSKGHSGIANDDDTSTRDAALDAWGDRPAVVFADLCKPPPGARQALVYAKSDDAGVMGCRAGWRRDVEGAYLTGRWPVQIGGRSSVVRSRQRVAGPTGVGATIGHPHAKPEDLMGQLITACPPGVIADPFAGSGSTLVAARNLGRHAIGVELDERYCETIARRLAQTVLL